MKKISISLKVLKSVRKDMAESGMKLTRDTKLFAHTYDPDSKTVNILRGTADNVGAKTLHEFSHGVVRRNDRTLVPDTNLALKDEEFLNVLKEERAANQTAKDIISTHSSNPTKDWQEYKDSAQPDYKSYLRATQMNAFYRNAPTEISSRLSNLAKNIPNKVMNSAPNEINNVFHRYARKKLPDFNKFVKHYSTKLQSEFSKPFDTV